MRPRNIWWSLQGAGPAQKAGTVKFGRQSGRKEPGGRWMPTSLPTSRSSDAVEARTKGKQGSQLFLHPGAPSLTVFLSLVASTADLLSMGKSTPCTYAPDQATATLGGRVPSILETSQYSAQAEVTSLELGGRPSGEPGSLF